MKLPKARIRKSGPKGMARRPARRRGIADEMAGMNPRRSQAMEPDDDEAMGSEALIGALVNKLAAAGMPPEMIMTKLQELFGGAEGMGAPAGPMPQPGMPPGEMGMAGMMAGMR